MSERPRRNLGLDLVRATEAAALAAGRWMGLGKPDEADQAATEAMWEVLNVLDMDGRIVIGEESRLGIHSPLEAGHRLGSGDGPELDVVVDPIDGRNLLAQGRSGAIAVAAIAPRGSMWSPAEAKYMEKIVVDREAADALVLECMDAPPAWTLALIARVKKKAVRDLLVFVLDRPRHAESHRGGSSRRRPGPAAVGRRHWWRTDRRHSRCQRGHHDGHRRRARGGHRRLCRESR